MKYVEKYANYLDSEGTVYLFDKLQKCFGDKIEPTAVECGITKASVYGWRTRKEDVKYSTKIKILETLIDKLPLETFLYLTDKLYNSSSETLLSCLSTLFEQSFDATNEKEYLKTVGQFENIVEKYSGLIYKNRDLEVNKLFLTMNDFAKSKNYQWKPHQTILLEYNAVKHLIPQIVGSWFYSSFPHSVEELAERTNLPIDIVQDVHDEFNKQLFSFTQLPNEDISERTYLGISNTAGTSKRSKSTPSLVTNT